MYIYICTCKYTYVYMHLYSIYHLVCECLFLIQGARASIIVFTIKNPDFRSFLWDGAYEGCVSKWDRQTYGTLSWTSRL